MTTDPTSPEQLGLVAGTSGRPPEDPERARLDTAHHEAGHAVVARALGRRVDLVTIERSQCGRWAGSTLVSRWSVPPADLARDRELPLPLKPARVRREAEVQICINLAGWASELFFAFDTLGAASSGATPASAARRSRPTAREAAEFAQAEADAAGLKAAGIDVPETDEAKVWADAMSLLGQVHLAGPFVAFLEGVTRDLVAQHQDTIRALAAELLEHGALSGRRVRELCSGSGP